MVFKGYYRSFRLVGYDDCDHFMNKSNANNSESSVALETTHTHIIVHTGLCHQVTDGQISSVSKVKCFLTVIQIIFLTITGCREYRNPAAFYVIFEMAFHFS